MLTLGFDAPRVRTVIFMAVLLSVVITLCFAFFIGVFQRDSDPLSYLKSVFSIFLGIFLLSIISSVLILARWYLWPEQRTGWNGLAITVVSIWMFIFVVWGGMRIYMHNRISQELSWVVDYGTPVSKGNLPPYFPGTFQRLEKIKKEDPLSSHFQEFSRKELTVYRRQGFIVTPQQTGSSIRFLYNQSHQVSSRVSKTPAAAQQDLQKLMKEAQADGYHQTKPSAQVNDLILQAVKRWKKLSR